jgi:hypothetical protein
MNSPDQLRDSGKMALTKILLIDAKIALSLLQFAAIALDAETKTRGLKATNKVCERVVNLMPRASLTMEQRTLLAQMLLALRSQWRTTGDQTEMTRDHSAPNRP